MIVITVILTLAVIAAVHYERSIAYSKEVTLHNNLSLMPQAIERYTLDRQEPSAIAPARGTKDWTTGTSDVLLASEPGIGGISDVHSG